MRRGNNMLDTRPRYPLAYFITFRCYGTWLHGDERGSTDRYRNTPGSPHIARSPFWQGQQAALLRHRPVTLDARRRGAVDAAIRDTCAIRQWRLVAANVRTNHVHAVVDAPCDPERVLSALKANATRVMRQQGCWPHAHSPWAHGGTKRYLWTEPSLRRAIDYVVNGQGDDLPIG
jgi:REP element-mobilizing transposase RayT